ncbi:putative flavin-containing monoamine oxidase AofH [Amycolatopsis deserti]|uniref:Flavin-containing monoamine oxidase AofH n=1 Tax=Amycolatopsis deserti TaxID=185696 RepID=A0ABQ3IN95_9PSEU|nr:NAD(P)/FAD-dependent oxidoreductase [Amycolatopsis deserti]GHE88761.1 putative flavin-containing monoamine oxidase AofH [Amycolatopsis deserti]
METADDGRRPVVVLGAGVAGLTAAHQLATAGVPVVVLEAGDRVGGRAYTVREGFAAGQQCDLGGELLLGPSQAITKLCAEVGVELSEPFWLWRDDTAPEELFVHGMLNEGHIVLGGEALRGERFAAVDREIRAAVRTHPPARHELVSQWVGRLDLSPDAEAALIAISHLVPYETHQIDVSGVLVETGHFTIQRIVGGSQVLPETLAKDLDVRLNSPARAVRQRRDGVEVELESGERLAGDRVIVAVPASITGALSFDPPLPANLMAALSSLQRARGGKVACQYAEGDAVRAALRQVVSSDGPVNTAFVSNQYTTEGPAVVSGFITGDDRFVLETEGAAADALDAVVEAAVGAPVTRLASRQHNWTTDPYVRSVSTYADFTGRGGAFAAQFAVPHHRVHFAGDHTDVYYQGTLEGAALSGLRAAGEVLRASESLAQKEIEAGLVRA